MKYGVELFRLFNLLLYTHKGACWGLKKIDACLGGLIL